MSRTLPRASSLRLFPLHPAAALLIRDSYLPLCRPLPPLSLSLAFFLATPNGCRSVL